MIEMNRIKAIDDCSNTPTTIKPKSESTLTFSLRLNNSLLQEWWTSHIENGKKTKVRVALQPIIEVGGKKIEDPMIQRESEFTTRLLFTT